MMRSRTYLVGVAIGLMLFGYAGSVAAMEDCFWVSIWRADNGSCGAGKAKVRNFNNLVYECESAGARQYDIGPPNFEGAPEGCRIGVVNAPNWVDHTGECETSALTFRNLVSACGGDPAPPADCSRGYDATQDKSGCVGDPVDLRTGALSLDPVDIDLGGGLRFQRHYASNALVKNPPNSATLPGMNLKWSHSLYWNAVRIVPVATNPVVVVTEPMRSPVPFMFDGTSYKSVNGDDGSVTVDPDLDVHFTNSTGTQADFNYNTTDSKYYLTQIRIPGEMPIVVSPGPAANETTFARGSRAIVLRRSTSPTWVLSRVTEYNNGSALPGQQWNFTYLSGHLRTVVGPDPTTVATNDTTTWTYTYKSTTPNGRLALVQRQTTSNPTPVTLGSWDYGTPFAWWDRDGANRVISADEQALEQSLSIAYAYSSTTKTLSASVSNSANELLAVFKSKFNKFTTTDPITPTAGALTSVTNTTGPAAPVPGGAGVDVPFVAQTTIGANNPLIKERTDKRGSKTLFESYDNRDRPGRIVKGWVDGPASPGVYSADDTYAALEETVWHPLLHAPLIEYSPSVLPGGGTKTTIYDYDDPAAPGDNPTIPNQSPTPRVYSITEQGFTLDASGTPVLEGHKTSFTYDAAAHITSQSGPRPENYTEHLYDPTSGFRTATRRYLNGPSSSYLDTTYSNFDIRGNPQTVTDPNLQATLYTYDSLSRVKTATPPFAAGSSTITFTYDLDGNLSRVDYPADSFAQPYFLRFGYDTKNRLTFLADAAGNAIVYERTAGRVTQEARYSGFVDLTTRGTLQGDSTFSYDAAGRLLKAFNPLFAGNTVFEQYGPDANGNPISVTDENGKPDSRLYDALDRLTQIAQVRSAATYVTQFDRDLQGRVKLLTDPSTKATDYVHDDFGRLVKLTSPNSGVTLYLHDEAGNLESKVENFTESPRSTTYAYDGLDRLTLVDLPTNADWVFSYDTSASLNQKGRLASVSNGIVTTDREYTPRGDLAVERTTVGGTSYAVTYGYDAGGNVVSIQAPSGVTTTYAHSGARPKTLTMTSGASQQQVRNIAFAPFGGRTRAEFPPFNAGTGLNTVISTRTYNLRGQVASIQVTAPSGTVLDQQYDYAYVAGGVGPNDPGPNLDRIIDNRDASQSRFYFYDELDRLWKETSLAGSPVYTYTYDANGNRIQEVGPGGTTSLTYEASTDRISQATGAKAKRYAHDVYGNQIWAGPTAYAGTPSRVFDESNRLVEVRDPTTSAVVGQYTYDAFARRVRKVSAAGTELFFYDATGQLLEERSLATSPQTVRDYGWIEQELVGAVDSGPQPVSFNWVHDGHIGTPLAVTSTPGAGNAQTIWRATHEPFGLASVDENPDGDGQIFALHMRFPGQRWDAEVAGHHNWQRYFDPSIGRYVSADPIGQAGGLNVYGYAANSPTNFVDPTGEFLQVLAPALATPAGQALAAATALALANAVVGTYDLIFKSGEEGDSCPVPAPAGPHTDDRKALNDLVNEATHGGRKPLSPDDTEVVKDWAKEQGIPVGDHRTGDGHWVGGDHIHIPGSGIPHIPAGR